MEIVPASLTVAQFCEGLDSNAIQVNRQYQRSDRVWPLAAQSFLIESVLLGYPIPKLFFFQQTDRVSRKTVNYIVDGQQRSVAIKAFYDDDLRLSRTLEFDEARGRRYSDLPDELQDRFLTYGLGIDYFVNTTEDDVREVFRRINSYEVPLNPEEQRHARWQGEFKWFIYHLSRSLDTLFLALGSFSQKQLVRMQDMKLLAEIAHAMLFGITTTNKRTLDAMYRDFDGDFPQREELDDRIGEAFDVAGALDAVSDTPLARPYSLYSLVLAVAHCTSPISTLGSVAPSTGKLAAPRAVERRLSLLAEALENDDADGEYGAFVKASAKATNTRPNRSTRFAFFVAACTPSGGSIFPRA